MSEYRALALYERNPSSHKGTAMTPDTTPTTLYRVFTRNWYKYYHGTLVPNPGARKQTIARNVTYSTAIDICHVYNSTHNPGKLSRKAEFTSI